MLTTIVLVLVIGLVAFVVSAGLIKLKHYYAVKRSNALARFVYTDVKKMLEDFTDHLMEKTTSELKQWYNGMMETDSKDED